MEKISAKTSLTTFTVHIKNFSSSYGWSVSKESAVLTFWWNKERRYSWQYCHEKCNICRTLLRFLQGEFVSPRVYHMSMTYTCTHFPEKGSQSLAVLSLLAVRHLVPWGLNVICKKETNLRKSRLHIRRVKVIWTLSNKMYLCIFSSLLSWNKKSFRSSLSSGSDLPL